MFKSNGPHPKVSLGRGSFNRKCKWCDINTVCLHFQEISGEIWNGLSLKWENLIEKENLSQRIIFSYKLRSNNEVKFVKTSSVQCANAQFLLVAPPKPRCGGYCHRSSKYCGRVVPMPCKPIASSKGQQGPGGPKS